MSIEADTHNSQSSRDTRSTHASIAEATFLEQPSAFLNFDRRSKMSLEDKSTLYRSLISLIRTNCEFDDALQDRAAQFLQSLEPKWNEKEKAAKLVTDLVPSSAGSPSDFVASILTLLSSPHSKVTKAALSFLSATINASPDEIRCRLVESDLITNLLATVQPHTLPISGNEALMNNLIGIIGNCVKLVSSSYLSGLGVTAAVEKSERREVIFHKVVIPSSQFVTFLIANRYLLNEELFHSLMFLFNKFIQICLYYRPTLEFVLASPIVMAFSSCLSIVEYENRLWVFLGNINLSLRECTEYGPEVVQCKKRMIEALFSEGYEDSLEQMMKNDKDGPYGRGVVTNCHFISQLLGSNVKNTEW
ncbi:hypothetical protein BLNAU_7177 [Blattamonas nauphoetae]|uniref:Uncharacterized protein n=1 Tax=Blattamonas nauphoetae TaxID=2049346 RepID=A0ABQ9Y224_9EUKA|nr:hypothetical protein BLNAU_7177 [Blattamonas nauphoetae]